MRTRAILWSLLGVLVLVSIPKATLAHWCSNIYQTYARIVVKPERQNINVAIGETKDLRVRVRNNFPYTLHYLKLRVNPPAGLDVIVNPDENAAGEIPILAGREATFVLSINRISGTDDAVTSLNIQISTEVEAVTKELMSWNNSASDDDWVIDDTNLDPNTVRNTDPQQTQCLNSYKLTELADFGCGTCEVQGMNGQNYLGLIELWDYAATVGGIHGTDGHQSLRAGQGLATRLRFDTFANPARSTAVQKNIDVMNGSSNNEFSRGIAAFYAAYGGSDSGVQAAIQNLADNDSSDNTKIMAKAALLMLGASQYNTEVTNCYQDGGLPKEARSVCAAALGIKNGDDAPLTNYLLDAVPPDGHSTSYVGLFASYVLQLVVFDRRGGPGGSTPVGFLGEDVVVDNVPPQAPQNFTVQPAP